MPELLRYYATDKEIFSLIMAAKQRVTESVLHEIANNRGIFCSAQESRETLARYVSLLPHDFEDLNEILVQTESSLRAEKQTSATLVSSLDVTEIKAAAEAYREGSLDKKVVISQEGTGKLTVNVTYTELDYSRTSLMQRREREASIEFFCSGDNTAVRMPANAKAEDIMRAITSSIEATRKAEIPVERIELTDFSSADERTEFFTSLITGMEGYRLVNVTDVKVQHAVVPVQEQGEEETGVDAEAEEDVEEEVSIARQEMISIVKDVAMRGESVLSSPQYRQLRDQGFYITSITWASEQTNTPYNHVIFEAGFDEPEEGKSFKYTIKGLRKRKEDGSLTKSVLRVTPQHKAELLPILEKTAKAIITRMRNSHAPEGNGVIA